jgi:hypothetical protein
MIYGVMVFVLAQVVFMPLVGGGVFSRGDLELIAGSLLGHLLYGAVVGWSYRGGRDDELIAHRQAGGSDADRAVHH